MNSIAPPTPWYFQPTTILIAGCIVAIINFGIRSTFGLFTLPFSEAFHWPRETYSFALALQNLVWGVATPVAGMLARLVEPEGATVAVGQEIAVIDDGNDPASRTPPQGVKEESAGPSAMDTTHADSTTNHVDPASDEKDKSRLNYDQRRLSLLNNPDYGVVLSFLDKFRSYVDVQEYPLHLLEENLLSHEETSKYPRP